MTKVESPDVIPEPSAASKYVVTALVLLAAVTIDSVARRGRTPGR